MFGDVRCFLLITFFFNLMRILLYTGAVVEISGSSRKTKYLEQLYSSLITEAEVAPPPTAKLLFV